MRPMHHSKSQPGDLLHTARTGANLSARQLGALAGINGSTITRIETGQIKNPRLDTLDRLLAAAGFELTFGTHSITEKDIR